MIELQDNLYAIGIPLNAINIKFIYFNESGNCIDYQTHRTELKWKKVGNEFECYDEDIYDDWKINVNKDLKLIGYGYKDDTKFHNDIEHPNYTFDVIEFLKPELTKNPYLIDSYFAMLHEKKDLYLTNICKKEPKSRDYWFDTYDEQYLRWKDIETKLYSRIYFFKKLL